MSHASDFPSCPGQAALHRFTVDGRSFWLHPKVAPIFEAFLKDVVARGYRLGLGILDDWSYACRPIRGSATPSEHSRGTAVDINATTNPMGSTLRTDMPSWVPVLAKQYGLNWGGWYRSRPDAMHFEFLGTAADASRIVAGLKNPRPAPSDDDGITPSDSPTAIRFLQVCLNLAGQHVAVDGVYGTATGQAIRNLKAWFNAHHVGGHVFDLSEAAGWKAGPVFLKVLADWLNFLKSQGAF